MKKTIQLLCVSLVLFAAQHAHSQVGLAIGIKGGPNFAKINTDASATQNYKSRTGFHAGAFVLIKASKIGVQPEILFSQQGSKVTINTKDYDANFSYINIPIIVKFYLAAGLNLQVGPQFGFISSAKIPMPDSSNPNNYSLQDAKKFANSSDLTAALGLGWDLPFGLTVDARYNMGLSKVYKSAPNSQTPNAKNQVFQVSLGYKLFKFGK